MADLILWISGNALALCTAAGSIATVAAAVFAAFELRRQSHLSRIQLEDKYDTVRHNANKLSLEVEEQRNMGRDTNTPKIHIEIKNHSQSNFSNLILHIPEFELKSLRLKKGKVPTEEEGYLYSIGSEFIADPHDWEVYHSPERFQVGNQPTTWMIEQLPPKRALKFEIDFLHPFEWNLWEGLESSIPELIIQPSFTTSIFFEYKGTTWYKTHGHPGSLTRTWPTWTPTKNKPLIQRTLKAVQLIRQNSPLLK